MKQERVRADQVEHSKAEPEQHNGECYTGWDDVGHDFGQRGHERGHRLVHEPQEVEQFEHEQQAADGRYDLENVVLRVVDETDGERDGHPEHTAHVDHIPRVRCPRTEEAELVHRVRLSEFVSE